MPSTRRATSPILVATAALAAGLLVVGWLDYRATREDLLSLLVEQANSVRHTVAAAARSTTAATTQTQATLQARLLDNARLLDQIDQRGGLSQDLVDTVARQNQLFRIIVLSATGDREFTAGTGGGPPAGAGRGLGLGLGPGGGRQRRGTDVAGVERGGGSGFGSELAGQLLHGSHSEAVSEIHGSRWGRGWRLSAGVRRTRGGAIVLNVDASQLAELQQQGSVEQLLDEVAGNGSGVAYVILTEGATISAHGTLATLARETNAPQAAASRALALPGRLEGVSAFERELGGTPVLEFVGPVDPGRKGGPTMRLGLSLAGLKSAERRSLTRLVLALLAALGLGILGLSFVALRQQHGLLRQEHALAQEALRRRDRLTAMGELASTVAHEVRNPLNAISMSVQRLRREFLDDTGAPSEDNLAERRELLDVLVSETRRIEGIVRQFLEYARPPKLVLRPVDLEGLLGGIVSASQALAATRGVPIEARVTGVGDANVDPDQFRQAIENLVRNAIDASSSGSGVVVHGKRSGDATTIVVEDHGSGIALDQLARIFDLYFTTKTDGTGVGLAVTHQIIEAHGGTIEVDSTLGRGTRMIVTLPPRHETDNHV
jgi:signal transduction histidine kinase